LSALPDQSEPTEAGTLGNYPKTTEEHNGMMKKLRHMFPDYDIEHFEREFQTWILTSNRSCDNYEAALIGFIRKAIEGFKPKA
jgi:hypothetical protein